MTGAAGVFHQRNRLRIWFVIVLAVFLVFAGRLVQVQGFQAEGYADRAISELMKTASLKAPRGSIYDANGVILAKSVNSIDLTVDPTQIADPAAVAAIIAPILNLPVKDVEASLTGTRRFAYVAKGITPREWRSIETAVAAANAERPRSQRIFGFYPQRSFKRVYPAGDLGASTLGFVNSVGSGAGGLEYAFDSTLAGIDGTYVYASGGGPAIPSARDVLTPAQPGGNLHLTINRDIQWVAQQAIADQVSKSKAEWGTVVVMDPRTGHVLALASAPSFDPEGARPSNLSGLRTVSVSDVYEPGSTGKIMTVAAALEEKVVVPTTVFSVPDRIVRANRAFNDHKQHPTWQMTTAGILAKSSNTGTIKIAEKMSGQTLRDYLTKFGIGQRTNVGFRGESPGVLPALTNWSNTTFPTVSFGQSYSVTALQATSVFATIANGGVRVSPVLVTATTDSNGNHIPAPAPEKVRVVSEETAKQVRIMMESVVSTDGTAPSAMIPGYRVAGKTGTAQRYDDACACYSGYVASFIGFTPADHPRLVISVTINNPKGLHWGGMLGGPIFKKVATFSLQTLGIPPTGAAPERFPLTAAELSTAQAASSSSRGPKDRRGDGER
jgi:cell division protein FtsI (penicillin-binding protein 3)